MTQPLATATFEPSNREPLEAGAGVAVVAAEACQGQNVGGKASALARLSLAGLPVPSFLVLLPPADPVASPCLDDAIRAAIGEWAEGDDLFAVRSSAADEDGRAQSYAGQLESYLFVPGAQVPDRVARVWQSGTSERVLAYRRAHGLDAPSEAPSVIVQRMVAADAAGVAFGADPVSGRSEMVVVSAVPGIGTGLVSGACDADCWRVDEQDEIVERSVVFKSTAHRPAPGTIEGIAPMPLLDAAAVRPVLRDDQIRAVARLTRRCGEMMGEPQDVEWAFAEDRLWLLQSRPITSLPPADAAADAVTVWDNSNIAESYNGITTPLTFSFARHAYEGVYREFAASWAWPTRRSPPTTAPSGA